MLMRGNKQLLQQLLEHSGLSGISDSLLQIWPGSRLVENNTGNKPPLWACKSHPRIAQLLILVISVQRHMRRLFSFQGCLRAAAWARCSESRMCLSLPTSKERA